VLSVLGDIAGITTDCYYNPIFHNGIENDSGIMYVTCKVKVFDSGEGFATEC
jgi:hypothetical protein